MPGTVEKTVQLAYGRGRLGVQFPSNAQVIEPRFVPGLSDEKKAVADVLRHPIGSRPLDEWIKPDSKICVLFTDITRATPNERLIPWLLEELSGRVPKQNITLVNSIGTHRPNTPAELECMLTADVVRNYRVVNHEPENPAALVQVGKTRTGHPALINKLAVEADAPFDIVVATNSGYPLDQNLYQAVKGISAASRIVRKGGSIIVAAECSDGLPHNSPYERLLNRSSSFEDVLRFILDPGREEPEQWQVIVQMMIQCRAEVLVHSQLPDEKVLGAKMLPCHDIAATVRDRMYELGSGTRGGTSARTVDDSVCWVRRSSQKRVQNSGVGRSGACRRIGAKSHGFESVLCANAGFAASSTENFQDTNR